MFHTRAILQNHHRTQLRILVFHAALPLGLSDTELPDWFLSAATINHKCGEKNSMDGVISCVSGSEVLCGLRLCLQDHVPLVALEEPSSPCTTCHLPLLPKPETSELGPRLRAES